MNVDPDLYRSLIYEFGRPMTAGEWVALKNNPTTGYAISPKDGDFIFTHVREISRNFVTQSANSRLIANRKQPNL